MNENLEKTGTVVAVSTSRSHTFKKQVVENITLREGHGVIGDAHMGETVKHRSRVAVDPTQLNLRQVHLIHEELLVELRLQGFEVGPGALGENILTQNIDLLSLPKDTILRIGGSAVVQITGLRNPCKQLDNYQLGLTKAVLARDEKGNLIRKAGIMGVVLSDGEVSPLDTIQIEFPLAPHQKLEPV
ncbi:MAG: MOSC domain-containing protein [Sneathiella sp.]